MGFLQIIREIQDVMEDVLPLAGRARLIDAHSFVWIINENKYRAWKSPVGERVLETRTQQTIEGRGGKRQRLTTSYNRSAKVVKEVKRRSNGICQLCGMPAPFFDRKGNPYLEIHHVIGLAEGGRDSTDNAVALCPNCHAKIHELKNPIDFDKLLNIALSYTIE